MTWKVAGSPIAAMRALMRASTAPRSLSRELPGPVGWAAAKPGTRSGAEGGDMVAPKRTSTGDKAAAAAEMQPSATGNAGVAGIDAAAAKPDMAGVRRAADRTAALDTGTGVFERSRLLSAITGRAGLAQRPRQEIR